MSFRPVLIAVIIGTSLVVAAFTLNSFRPRVAVEQPTEALIRASGKCAECHINQQYSVVHEYELSRHAQKGINCLDCHQPAAGQKGVSHHSFVIAETMTAANCRSCHEAIYQQFVRSRHAAPSWAAVYGDKDLTPAQVAFSEQFHPGATRRGANPLVAIVGMAGVSSGCASCHAIGRPNADGSIGTCTACHARHTSSVELARLPSTCGQCHMGPDHSQIEIYTESKHGVLFEAQHSMLNLKADPKKLTTADMFVPTCATCHMSGLNGLAVTHDPSDRLSYLLFAEVSTKRPDYARAQANMKAVCLSCHTQPTIDKVYTNAEAVVAATNEKVLAAKKIVDGLHNDGVLPRQAFQNPIDFLYFDLWHYYGRTAKHGAFMGGADYVQWHGNYPIAEATVRLKQMADELRKEHKQPKENGKQP